MWNIDTTTRLLKDMSLSANPGELVWLFFEHVRRIVHVNRVLVLTNTALVPPQYRLVHDVTCNDVSSGSVVTLDELRQGGLLAKLLYLGEFQNIIDPVSDATDSDCDLVQGYRSLTAFPLFEKGSGTGMVVLLGDAPHERSPAELCTLAMVTSLLGRAIEEQKLASQLDVACRTLDSELEAAAAVQRWLLPPPTPRISNTEVAVSYRTSRRSGGDYYDLGELPDGRIGVLVADVSGKGAAAAMLVAVLRTILHELGLARVAGPAALLDYADSRLCTLGLSKRGAFVTAFCCALDPATGTMTYSSAGHNPPRLLRARQGVVVPLDGANTTPLGILDEPRVHEEAVADVPPGDLTVLYTDGITEAMSSEGELFGDDRLDATLRALPQPVTAASAVDAVTRAISRFEGTGPRWDDQTLLVLRPEVAGEGAHPVANRRESSARAARDRVMAGPRLRGMAMEERREGQSKRVQEA